MVGVILTLHILVALSSVALGSFLLARPARAKLLTNYGLIGLTVASGTYLIVATGKFMLSTCLVSLSYVLAVTVLSVVAERRFATQKA